MDQLVTVDHGDLLEVCQAAEAWAGYLRKLTPAARDYNEAADRIDQAIFRCSRSALGDE